MTMELDPTELRMIEYMNRPLEQWEHSYKSLNKILRQEIDYQFAEEGSSERGGSKQWPPLKPKYKEKKLATPGVLFGGHRIMILFGKYWKASILKARIRFKGNMLIGFFAVGVKSKDGFDYPSYWNKQLGPISPDHAGARPMVVTPRFAKEIADYFTRHLKQMFGD